MLILKPFYDPAPANGGEGGAAPQANEKETQEYQTLLTKKDTELNDQEKTRLAELKGKYEVKLKGEDGKELTPDQIQKLQADEKKFNDIMAKPEDQRTKEENEFIAANSDPGDEKAIYEQVEEATGLAYKIDYGDVEPTSVDGIVMREEAIRKHAVADFEARLKSKFPQAHQYMLHLSQGGKAEDFFKPENQDFLQLTVKKEDVAGQERVLRTAMAAKGVSPAIIDATVTTLKDSGQLFDLSKAELEALQTLQKQKEQQREQNVQRQREKEEQDVTRLSDQVDSMLEKGFEGIKIHSQVERDKFAQFLFKRLDYYNGAFVVARPLDDKNLERELKFAWFEYKNGNIQELAERTAKSQNALKFKKAYRQEFIPKVGGGGGGKPTNVPIGSI